MTAQPDLLQLTDGPVPNAPAVLQHTDQAVEVCARVLLPPHPYTGLRPFQTDEWPIFCGRDRIIQEIIDILGRSHLVFVIGASGSGKSSLVRAGVLATVEGRHSMVGVRWRTTAMRPGAEPFLALAEAVLEAEASQSGDQVANVTRENAVNLSLGLENATNGLAAIADRLQIRDNENLLLLVDQFEEIFRYQASTNECEGQRFIEQLVRVAQERPPGLYVAVTMRAEFLSDCTRYRGLADVVNRTHYLVPPMSRTDLEEAITRPARLMGGDVQGPLVERLLADIAGREDHLPILQHSLALMWTEGECADSTGTGRAQAPVLTLERYEELKGDADSLMARHCEQIYLDLAPESRKVAETMFRRMVEVEERRTGLRRPTRFGTVAELAGVGLAEVEQVADGFAAEGASFIQISRWPVTGETSLDITHESLIRQWPRLDGWLRAERRSYETLKDLTRAARRRAEDAAGLWSGQELASALAWREEDRPTQLWARRYDGDFSAAMRFLLESEDTERRTQEARQQAEEREVRRAAEAATREQERRLDEERRLAQQAEAERDLQTERAQAAEALSLAAADREREVRKRYQWARRGLRIAIAMTLVMAGLFGYAIYQKIGAVAAQKDAEDAQKIAVTAQKIAESAQDVAESQRKIAEETRGISTRLWTLTGRAQRANDGATGSVLISLAFLELGLAAPEVEGLAYAGLQRLREKRVLRSEGTQVSSVWFAPDGTVSAMTAKGTAETWSGHNLSTYKEHRVGGLPRNSRARPSADGRFVLVGSFQGGGMVLSRTDGMLKPKWSDPKLGPGVLSRDGQLAVVGRMGFPPALWDVLEQRHLWSPEPSKDSSVMQSAAVAISEDGTRFAVVQKDKIEIRSTLAPYQELRSLELRSPEMKNAAGSTPQLFSLAFNPHNPEMLLGTGLDGHVLVWVEGKADPVRLPGHKALVFEGTFSHDGTWIATAGEDRAVRLWRVTDVRAHRQDAQSVELRGHSSSVFSVAFSQDGHSLASGSSDSTVRIWDIDPVLRERSEMVVTATRQETSPTSGETVKQGENLTLLVEKADGFKIELKVPYDFGEPAYTTVSGDHRYVLVAPRTGRPLLYRSETPQAPVAELGEQRRKWDGVFFDQGDVNRPAAISNGMSYFWTFFDKKDDLVMFAGDNLPFDGPERVKLSEERQCLLGLMKDVACAKLPRDNSN